MVFAVRKGNPKNIKGWDDLVKPGVEIVTPNPASSGAARWNTLAAYGQVIADGGTEADAEALPDQVLRQRRRRCPSSGRDATTAFLGGTGDVLMAYENEAILARQNGEDFDYIVPDTTLLIENPGAVLNDADPKAQDWLDFVLSDDGQKRVRPEGLPPDHRRRRLRRASRAPTTRPTRSPTSKNLLTVDDDFGSWDALSNEVLRRGERASSPRSSQESGKASSDDAHSLDRTSRPAPTRAGRPRRRRASLTRRPGSGSASR